MKQTIRILGIAGSLRASSYNRRLLEAAVALAPVGTSVIVYDRLHTVPLFNEDLEGTSEPSLDGVAQLRAAVEQADALLIATPEYNQSIPGVLKNAIDWMSRSPSVLRGKPVALLGATVGEWGTRHAQAAARHTLFACGAELVQVPHLYLRKAANLFADDGMLDSASASELVGVVEALAEQTKRLQAAAASDLRAAA